jgi:hypothetical protein
MAKNADDRISLVSAKSSKSKFTKTDVNFSVFHLKLSEDF